MTDAYARYEPLLAARVPPDKVVLGRAYVIHARNVGVGVAVRRDDGLLGYKLRREKHGDVYLFVALDWEAGAPFGTAIPLAPTEEDPPEDDEALLGWLKTQEDEHQERIDAAWRVVLGSTVFDSLGE
jgi:hypothetical protein